MEIVPVSVITSASPAVPVAPSDGMRTLSIVLLKVLRIPHSFVVLDSVPLLSSRNLAVTTQLPGVSGRLNSVVQALSATAQPGR